MNNAPYGTKIENLTRRTDIKLLNDILTSRRLADKPHCVDFHVFDGQLAPRRNRWNFMSRKRSSSKTR